MSGAQKNKGGFGPDFRPETEICAQDKPHEECGVFGIYDRDGLDAVHMAYVALFALQHRGQESCGIAINDRGVIRAHRDLGLVQEVFGADTLRSLGSGQIAVGHVRYSTTGSTSRENAQPLVMRYVKGGLALAHNGNLINAFSLKHELEQTGAIFQTTSDTEVMAYIIARKRLKTHSIEEALFEAMKELGGAYSIVMMSPQKLIAARDPYGFRPLCIGKIGDSTVFASESCALDAVGAEFVRDVEPGEIVVADKDGVHSLRGHCGSVKHGMCVFEYIYFARPDSIIDGISVHEARRMMGKCLAIKHPVEADIVVGVPDSGLDAALGYSEESGIPYGIGLIKNKYIGRTFIQPTQSMRSSSVRIKLNALSSAVRGKRVVLVDDSIVRGTTSARIVSLLRDAGAKEVHMRISAPPFRNPCYFGTDIDSRDRLIACRLSIDGICKSIGADTLGYFDPADLWKVAGDTGVTFCDGCFTGRYPVEVPDEVPKNRFENRIGDDPDNSEDEEE
jgi:amidophosphoribosyltransferase